MRSHSGSITGVASLLLDMLQAALAIGAAGAANYRRIMHQSLKSRTFTKNP
ncbi:hypothetical protein [Pontibacter korlensis]|uniref:hypothetical protein n=1 Tax=Pontibacter korlensis TaxID=400092 RepID=UPI00130D5B7B|nr:hypothetical protein [Pontibacter korlensis]